MEPEFGTLGTASDTGVTGRKIVVDTYGEWRGLGEEPFLEKIQTKVDRSGAYAARYMQKNIVAADLADRCEVRLAYFIEQKNPLCRKWKHLEQKKNPKK